ncbi:acyltransferase [Agathobaculum sp. LCP25S3_E8]|uniref:acyltransferase n=1 Tax=Agathobaculum sp. LCP25S3_E8 TaxID=3438735 RepID=UPI003F90BF45
MASFFAFLAFLITSNVFSPQNSDQEIIALYSQDAGKRVVYRGASVDGKWYNPWENVIDAGNWELSDEGSSTYTATDGTAFRFTLPNAEQRLLTFNVGPNEGSVMVEIGDETISFDLNAESEVENGKAFEIPFRVGANYTKQIWIAAAVTFVFAFLVVFMMVGKKRIGTRQKPREVWGDVLRIFCCYIIVLLHNTCTIFSDYADGRISALIMNCFTGFAVPCFFMISGAYLLRKPQSISSTLKRRVMKIVLPTLFWGVIYLYIGSILEVNKFLKILFVNQEPHLWFMYSLFGIYMLLPLISNMYHALSLNQKIYALVLLLIIPGLIYDGSKLLGFNIPNYSFSIFWPDLGLFLCGGVLWELRNKIQSYKFYQFVLLCLLGLAISVADTVYISQLHGQPDKTFISAIGSWGNLIMAASVFCMALSNSEFLQKKVTGLRAHILHEIGNVTMGIYFIHVIFLTHLNHSTLSILPLYSNSGSMLSMILSAFVYFAISVVVCWCGKQVKGLARIFG